MHSKLFLACLGLAAIATPVAAETLTNADITMLLQAGLGEEAVIAKVETSGGNYVTDTASLLELRSQGVPSSVIAAMLKASIVAAELSDMSPDPLAPHYPGIYLLDEWSEEKRMWRIDPTSSSQTKTGGILGYALTGGIASASVKAVIPGDAARVVSQKTRPLFYIYFDEADGRKGSAFMTGFGSSVQSPNEFSLVKLNQKKGRREARIGSMNIAGAKAGVMDKDQIPFTYEQVAANVFMMQPTVELEAGEYGFIYAVGGGVGPGLAGSAGTAGARVFGFGVR